eukprot:3098671-Rhodomonas_salina.1
MCIRDRSLSVPGLDRARNLPSLLPWLARDVHLTRPIPYQQVHRLVSHPAHVTRRTGHVTPYPRHVTAQAGHVTAQVGHVTRHTGHVTASAGHVSGHTRHVTGQSPALALSLSRSLPSHSSSLLLSLHLFLP